LLTFQKRKEKKTSHFFFQFTGCGNYGPAGSFADFDFVHIPMAFADGTAPLSEATSNFCGGGLVGPSNGLSATLSMTMAANQVTICSKYQKYNLLL
jgi:hypothetical protein